ncbi:hypothetical protein HJ01_01381 [Flavobacterium frigoris PS1]|uniref:Uncharacterized protein n=1 Tax=Flavobacterium frigoris (strain PS1) TaxID=1086011 RepID=H7FQC1_FLAFP|nr:hypothetical protein HJ01_01381 [Flavobacterium frigoris PS1]
MNPAQQEIKANLETVVWDDTVEAYEVEKRISKWFFFFN